MSLEWACRRAWHTNNSRLLDDTKTHIFFIYFQVEEEKRLVFDFKETYLNFSESAIFFAFGNESFSSWSWFFTESRSCLMSFVQSSSSSLSQSSFRQATLFIPYNSKLIILKFNKQLLQIIKFTKARSTISNSNRMTFTPGSLQFASGTVRPPVRSANRFEYRRWCGCRCGRCRTSATTSTVAVASGEETQFLSALLRQRLAFSRNHGRWLQGDE